LDADAGDPALFELAYQAPHVVEVAIARISVQQDRQIAGVGHELQHVHDLRPARFVVVAHPELGRYRKAGRPDPAESRLVHDARRQTVVGLHQELKLLALQHLAQPAAAGAAEVLAVGPIGHGDAGCACHVHFHDWGSGWSLGNTSSFARVTSSGKSISIQGAPVTSATSKIRPRSNSRSRTASSCGAPARSPAT